MKRCRARIALAQRAHREHKYTLFRIIMWHVANEIVANVNASSLNLPSIRRQCGCSTRLTLEPTMTRSLKIGFALLIASFPLAGCAVGPSAAGSFDRTVTIAGPVRLELANASGDVEITGSADGKVHIHGDARSSGFGFDAPQKRLDLVVSNPPIEQTGNTVRVGKSFSHTSNVTISYVIEVPRDTEISTSVASGSQTIKDVRGPVKVNAASGSIRVMNVERETQLATMSGSIDADTIGDDLRASSASGSVTASNVKGDVKISAL